jgi:hypothetical protein
MKLPSCKSCLPFFEFPAPCFPKKLNQPAGKAKTVACPCMPPHARYSGVWAHTAICSRLWRGTDGTPQTFELMVVMRVGLDNVYELWT